MKREMATLLGLVSLVAASPVTAASLGEDPIDRRTGGAAVLRLRIPLGRSAADHGRLGLAMNIQHRLVTAEHQFRRIEAEGLELGIGPTGPVFLVGGADIVRLDERFGAGGERKSPWGTIGLVVGGAALLGGAYLLHIIHESEKNSD